MTDFAGDLRELSEPWPSGDRVKTAIDRAARLAGLSYWRAFDIWYGKARRVEQSEQDQINEALRLKRERSAANELHELKFRLARLEAALAAGNTHHHREGADASRSRVCRRGGVDSAVAVGPGARTR